MSVLAAHTNTHTNAMCHSCESLSVELLRILGKIAHFSAAFVRRQQLRTSATRCVRVSFPPAAERHGAGAEDHGQPRSARR